MNDSLNLAQEALLAPAELTQQHLENVLGTMLGHQIDAGELFFQALQHESWALEDGIIKDATFSRDRGVGVRALSGEKTGFAYCDEIMLPALQKAASAASTIAYQGGQHYVRPGSLISKQRLYAPIDPLTSCERQTKVALLQKIDDYAKKQDSRVKQVFASLSGLHEVMLVMHTDGTFVTDVRPLVRLNVEVIVEQNGRREQGFSGGGGRFSYQYFLQDDHQQALALAQEAVRQALVNLEAVAAPAGTMPVVLGPGWPGVLLHEAIGHGLEGDFNRKQSSAFANRLGERVAHPDCTVVDDGTLKNRRGSLNFDDEGTPSQCNVLIENGILKNYMQDKLNAKLMGMHPTGNARRESYAHMPMPRMTNTYKLAGDKLPEEIIRSVDKGLYAVNFGGGQVDITSGKFVFSASEAYLIENGQVTRPVKGATLIGHGPEVLKQVSMVGNDLKLDSGVGVCGKEGQSVPVGVGQPTLKVDSLTVGGTQS
jgi:TldD protein